MKKLLGTAAIAALAGSAHGQIVFSEILGSTSSTDTEFIEIANLGALTVDISGYQIELWESRTDNASGYPQLDGGSPYIVPGGTLLGPGAVYTMGTAQVTAIGGDYTAPNPTTYAGQPFNVDMLLADNSVENSSYTAILTDATGVPILDSWYVTTNGATDAPNRNGVGIVPNYTLTDPAGFLPAGGYRGFGGLHLLNFNRPGGAPPTLNNGTLAGGTPGIFQIPAPGTFAFAGLGGLLMARRRR